uniref:Polyadenylate-binding protein-interacting protein 1 n=1 Tax=Accipiter nisus TaxID=211598 RepID=A0A8B9NF76_9AVES
ILLDGYDGYLTLAEYVQDFLNHLAEQPGCFETEIEQFAETLNGWVTADETLQELVELVYQQATSVPNFSYMGARLCNYLSHHLTISPQSGNFRQLLLQRCRTEYENRDEAAKGDETTRKQFHAFVLFLAELYLNLEIKGTKGQVTRAEILQEGIRQLLNALFSNPVDNNLMCAVKLLKVRQKCMQGAFIMFLFETMDVPSYLWEQWRKQLQMRKYLWGFMHYIISGASCTFFFFVIPL